MSPVLAQTDETAKFSGFARLVFGYLDESNATYLGYDNDFSLDQQSLIGLQADFQLHDKLSMTGQFIGHSGDERQSGVEWLYLTYEPIHSMQIKMGKQRTPFFNYSDSIDVGFAYPWITLPQQVYSTVFFSSFDGILANYQWSGKELALDVEGYWGSFDGKINTAGSDVTANINDLHGLITKLAYDNWTFRASFHSADTYITFSRLNEFSQKLNKFGFDRTANSLNSNGKIEFYQVSASYENVNYFFRTEIIKNQTESAAIPNNKSYFVVAGYNYFPFLSYLSFAKSKSTTLAAVNEIPMGIDPATDALAFHYQRIHQDLPFDSSQSITLGTRWDIRSTLALKAEITWIEAEEGSGANFIIVDRENFDRKAPLYQLALEWIF